MLGNILQQLYAVVGAAVILLSAYYVCARLAPAQMRRLLFPSLEIWKGA